MREFPQDDPDNEFYDKILDQVRAILGEHFEVAVVMCSLEGKYGTSYHGFDLGNKFAIRGMVDSYVNGEMQLDDIDQPDD